MHIGFRTSGGRGESAELVFGTNDPYEVGSQIRSWLSEYLLSGPLIPCELAGNRAVTAVRNLIGDTLPIRATPGSIRADYSTDSPDLAASERRPVHNLIHASGDVLEADRELKLWFPES